MFPWGSHTLVAFDVIHTWTLRPVATVESWFPTVISLRYLLTFGFLEQPWRPHANREAASSLGHQEGLLLRSTTDALTEAKETHLPSPWGAPTSVSCEELAAFTPGPHTLSSPPPGHTPCCRDFHYVSLPEKKSAWLRPTNTYPSNGLHF